MRILIIEDEPVTATLLKRGLKEAGHVVDHAPTGVTGLYHAGEFVYDVMIVDRMLPDMDGLEIVASTRRDGARCPVLVLSALADVAERERGLRAGGDDYLVKPFSFRELLARVEGLARRRRENLAAAGILRVADLELDLSSRRLYRGGEELRVTVVEVRIVECLMRHCDQVVTRTMFFEQVWDYHFDPATNVIDVHISRLRARIDAPGHAPLIHTVRGAGYCLRAPPPAVPTR